MPKSYRAGADLTAARGKPVSRNGLIASSGGEGVTIAINATATAESIGILTVNALATAGGVGTTAGEMLAVAVDGDECEALCGVTWTAGQALSPHADGLQPALATHQIVARAGADNLTIGSRSRVIVTNAGIF